MVVSVCDFCQVGKPMNWVQLGDLLKGMGRFLKDEWKTYQEMSFSIVVDEVGLVGTGHLKWEQEGEALGAVEEES